MTESQTKPVAPLSEEALAEIEAQLEATSPGGDLSIESMKLMVTFEARQREYVRALCQTVRALRAEKEWLRSAVNETTKEVAALREQLARVRHELEGTKRAADLRWTQVQELRQERDRSATLDSTEQREKKDGA